ncbi:MAG: hypothetical protein ACTHMS_21405 [Jatrophihabitans sp.]|uniref:hypothetical protein n=1 Tax=Jatrophihabitans sp. TaxID=1932789 RepID=UPI003F82392E
MTTAVPEAAERHLALFTDLIAAYAVRRPIERIAVVGNAPLEPDPARADAVDAADLVIRVNSFVVDPAGGPRRTGRRADVAVMARATRPTADTFREYSRRLYLVVDAGNMNVPEPPRNYAFWPKDLGAVPIPNATIGHPLKVLLAPENDGARIVPTSGTLAAYLGWKLFPSAHLVLTGFSFIDDADQKRWKHQSGRTVPMHPAHSLEREQALMLAWLDSDRAELLR